MATKSKTNNETKSGKIEIADGFEFEVVNVVSVPTLKMTDGVAEFVCFDSAMIATPKKGKDGAALDEDGNPASITTAKVVNLKTGEIMALVCGAGLKDNLKLAYPNDGYVGRCFRLVKSVAPGKRWKAWDVREVKDPRNG
jgi:hypothetical protein